jgi:hypothetical protein
MPTRLSGRGGAVVCPRRKPKGWRSRIERLSTSPVTSAFARDHSIVEVGVTTEQAPKKTIKTLEVALRQIHDAMEIINAYDHDKNFVPDRNQLLLFEFMHKQVAGFSAMAYIIVQEMRSRAREAER